MSPVSGTIGPKSLRAEPPERIGSRRPARDVYQSRDRALIQMDGLNILYRSNLGQSSEPVYVDGPEAAQLPPPRVKLEDLPPIDIILVSHNHYDHMDKATLPRLASAHRPRTITTLGNRAYLEPLGVPVAAELDSVAVRPSQQRGAFALRAGTALSRDAVPAIARQHYGRDLLESKAGNVYFAADSGWGPHFEEIGRRFGPFRLSFLPIVAFRSA